MCSTQRLTLFVLVCILVWNVLFPTSIALFSFFDLNLREVLGEWDWGSEWLDYVVNYEYREGL